MRSNAGTVLNFGKVGICCANTFKLQCVRTQQLLLLPANLSLHQSVSRSSSAVERQSSAPCCIVPTVRTSSRRLFLHQVNTVYAQVTCYCCCSHWRWHTVMSMMTLSPSGPGKLKLAFVELLIMFHCKLLCIIETFDLALSAEQLQYVLLLHEDFHWLQLTRSPFVCILYYSYCSCYCNM